MHRSQLARKRLCDISAIGERGIVSAPYAAAAKMLMVGPRTAEKCADRYRTDGLAELLHIAATLITVTLEEGPLTECMASRYPWMYALSAQEREQCARDLIDAARASFSTQQPHLAITQLASRRETATTIAAGLGSQPVEWLDEDDDPTNYPLEGSLAVITRGKRTFQRWQHKPTLRGNSARLVLRRRQHRLPGTGPHRAPQRDQVTRHGYLHPARDAATPRPADRHALARDRGALRRSGLPLGRR